MSLGTFGKDGNEKFPVSRSGLGIVVTGGTTGTLGIGITNAAPTTSPLFLPVHFLSAVSQTFLIRTVAAARVALFQALDHQSAFPLQHHFSYAQN
ncbi:hypothetical protein [Enterococcus sp. DIV0724b]|uniref:hypothetical protein n=1 Tax=Enterococcus sp. DIV0724b TaxID=2774694 RepID=UPI003D2FAC76